ncbi:MAG: cadmium-translocating P-type ATPase [Gammaproteobacteria bacterium]|nr:cadmium-translocating P-type ATPase [Gammaproteobacteria bacterium]NNF62127.1 cadmium-translocating P-type ATPase [Gammaproteobacteria bacterium]
MNAHSEVEERFAAFDRPAIARSFVHAVDERDREATLVVDGIHCASCGLRIEKGLTAVTGVREIHVNPTSRHATLRWDSSSVSLGRLMQTIADLGFTPHPLRQDTRSALHTEEYRAALKRLIVAGLGMMQVMTYAVAGYFGAFAGMATQYQQFFRLLSLLVATPIVLYSAAPFFRAAVSDLSHRRVGMDVPVALAIGLAYAASVYITFFGSLHSEVYFDSVVMFTFFLSFGRFAEMLARHRTMATSEALSESIPAAATRLTGTDDNWTGQQVPLAQVQPGDRLLVRPGETVPADGIVAWGTSATDEALLTGESQPRTRRPGDAVIGGSINLTGPLHIEVTEVGPDTVLSGIARLLERAQGQRPRMAQMADRVAAWFVATILLIAVLVALAWLAIDPGRALTVTLSVLVVTCPCALSLATPAALTAATGYLARNGLLVTRGSAVETLAKADTILLDKTGTLTRGRLKLVAVRLLADHSDEDYCRRLAAALEAGSAHPVAAAFRIDDNDLIAEDVTMHPGRGIEGVIGGETWRIGNTDFVIELAGVTAAPDLTPGVTSVLLGKRHQLLAAFELEDALRPEAAAAITQLRGAGLQPAILSGDAAGPVSRVATRLGIEDYHAALLPGDKLAQVQQRRAAGKTIAMVGDGINDAPVLAGADVSIAMGSGSSLAQASADLVLLGGGLDRLVGGIYRARKTRRIIRQNLTWAIVYNLVALPLAAAGLVAPWMAAIGMSASSLIVVLNALRLARDGEDNATITPRPQALTAT